LWSGATTSVGCGRCCVGALDKLLPFSSVTVLRQVVGNFGKPFRKPIALAIPTAISGVLILRSCHRKLTIVGKETGLTAHQERWYCTLRQRLARYVRQTLSFSKKDAHHVAVTRWFITQYNLRIRASLTF